MKKIAFFQLLLFRLLLTLAVATLGVICLFKQLPYTFCFCVLLFIILTIHLFGYIKNYFSFYDKTISAILSNDFSANLANAELKTGYPNLVKLYENLRTKQYEKETQDIIYRSLLNSIESAVLILHLNGTEWEVFFTNNYFYNYFEIPSVTRWKYMEKHIPALYKLIEDRNFEEIRTSVQIKTSEGESQAFMFQSAKTITFGKTYYTVLLDSIQNVVAKREKDAWINLMKVISHELMNSVTPIRSLSQNMDVLVHQKELSEDDMADIRQSVATMIHRSNHLQNFIDSYRKLAMLPSPDKKPIDITALIEQVLQIMAPIFKQYNINVQNTINQACFVSADVLQIEQLFINLFTNSAFALEHSETRNIEINSIIKPDRLFISIKDSGHGIEKEIEDKIFLPFFTTRKNGSGIGLTLSKNIIEGHGGYLNYSGDNHSTTFTVCFIRKDNN